MKETSRVIFGGTGKLGKAFLYENPEFLSPSHEDVDITSHDSVQEYLHDHRVGLVVHAAAVVGAKEAEINRDRTYKVNVDGTENIVHACERMNIRLIYISSVSVFDGIKGEYQEQDTPNPTYYYGVTKLLGERVVHALENSVIIRTDFFDPGNLKYRTVFKDHYSSKIHVAHLVKYLSAISQSDYVGVLNVGQERDTLFNILKPYSPDILGITIAQSELPDFPRDLSLDVSLLHQLFPEVVI